MKPSATTVSPERSFDEYRSGRLGCAFYERDALDVARDLIGKFLVHRVSEFEWRAARIVETEAYRGPDDGACHARAGLTKRTRTLLGPPAHAYVFVIYGMYDCFNVVCREVGGGHAVLVRAAEPAGGIATGVRLDGPGRLARGLGISRVRDGADLTGDEIFLSARGSGGRIETSPRVGVAYAGEIAEAPWRFLDADSAHVSKPRPHAIGLGLAR